MRWMFDAVSLFTNEQTRKKFSVLTWGAELANVLGPNVPMEYGGNNEALDVVGEGLRLRKWGEGEKSPAEAWKAGKKGGEVGNDEEGVGVGVEKKDR